MASIKRRSDGRWRARWTGPDGKEKAKHFDRKVDAERFLDTIRGDLARGTYIDPSLARTTFGIYAEGWRAAQVHRQSTVDLIETNLRRHVLPTFEHRALGSVRTTEVQAWVRKLTETLAPSSVEGCYRLFASIFRAAVADRLIPSSPCVGIRMPKKARAKIDPLSVKAVEEIRAELPHRVQAAATLAAGAGLRQGEVFGLTVDRVDFLRRQVTIDRQLVTPQKGDPHLGPPKTEASVRTIPLPAWSSMRSLSTSPGTRRRLTV